MDPIVIGLLLLGNIILIAVFVIYERKFRRSVKETQLKTFQSERELKRRVLELQVLHSLGERVGYSLDLNKILEVITDSLKGLVDYSTVSYMILGLEGRIALKTHIDESISRLFLDQVKGQMLSSISMMVQKNLHPSLIDETVSGSNLDERVIHPVGSFFNLPVIIGGQVVAVINVSSMKKGLYADQETTVLYTIINQVTSQASKLSQVLENEKRRLSAMVSSLTDGIIMVDSHFNLIVSNPAVNLILNLSASSTLVDMMSAVRNHCDLKQLIEQSLTLQQIQKVEPFEINGTEVQIEIEPVKDKFGYLLGSVVVLRDISAQKQLERLRDDFTAMMVHELRTPLTTISYGVEAILSEIATLSTAETEHYLSVVKGASSDMLGLVNDLLDVSRIEAGKFEVVKKEGNLVSLIEEKTQALKPLADQKKLELLTQIDPNLTSISFDRLRLGQAITNLVANAIKYTDHGMVKISAFKDKDRVVVSIADSGDGIKAEDLPKLFSKFRQLGRGKTGEKGGTGLGLVIVKGIIEAHDGQIWAESKGWGQGSTFIFTLPHKNTA